MLHTYVTYTFLYRFLHSLPPILKQIHRDSKFQLCSTKKTIKVGTLQVFIRGSDVVSFADELLRDGLRVYSEFEVRVAGTVTVSQLVSDAISKVGGSRDKFDKFVSTIESRDRDLASNLKSDYLTRRLSTLLEYEEDQLSDHDLPPSPKRQKEHDFCADYVTSLRQAYKAPLPHWEPLPLCQHIKLSMIKRTEGKAIWN